MKKFIFVTVAAIVSTQGFAQKAMHSHTQEISATAGTGAKTTAVGDTTTLSNIASSDTVRVLYTHAAGGYTTGINAYNDKGFAERFSFNGNDSSVKIIGVLAQFGGTVNPSSTKNVTLKVWGQRGSSGMVAPHTYYQGFPDGILDSLVVPITQIGIGATADTLKQFMFATPTNFISGSFFVGYTINYNYAALGGDTIALASSTDGHRTTADYYLGYKKNAAGDTVAVDTFLNVQNATLWSDNGWRDNYTQNDSLYNNLAIFPIVIIGSPTSVKGITHNNLTLFGAYPNPATSSTNIRFTLKAAADVTIDITDMSGRNVRSEKLSHLPIGEHTTAVNTAALPAGEYLYIIRTSQGDGMAGKLEIAN